MLSGVSRPFLTRFRKFRPECGGSKFHDKSQPANSLERICKVNFSQIVIDFRRILPYYLETPTSFKGLLDSSSV